MFRLFDRHRHIRYTKEIVSNFSLRHHVIHSSISHSNSIFTPTIPVHHPIFTSMISSSTSHSNCDLIHISIFTAYTLAISSSRTIYYNFLIPQKCNFLKRYFGFPKMITIHPRPLDTLNPYILNAFHVPSHLGRH